ncbi:MAG: cache domain-containing protein [Ktedonobacteraceae bacterium]|nr:cache domain-containing protein [Ktedonobacteraceae bacterium]
MAQQVKVASGKRRLPLSLYISLLLALTAIVSLFATIGSIESLLRPALVKQLSTDMQRSAQTRVQLIDTYLAERMNDIKTLSQATPVKTLLSAGDANSRENVRNMLFTVQHRDVANYISLTLLNAQGNIALSYPSDPQLHGKHLIVPEIRDQLQQSSSVAISNVFYDLTGNKASVDIYAGVLDSTFHTIGYIRGSLGLHRIWEPVDGEPQAIGADSYGFILDQNGVRIAYTNPDRSGFTHPRYLFKAITPLSPQLQQRIKDEDLYGNSTSAVTTIADPQLAALQNDSRPSAITEFTPAEQNQTYVVVKWRSTVVPWTYYILRPLNSVAGLADQQLLTVILIVVVVLTVAIIAGLLAGRRIAQPISRSVAVLRNNSKSLKELANDEHTVANEQTWLVEASRVALESIKYYTNAASIAAQRIHTVSTNLVQNSQTLDAQRFNKAMHDIVEAASYIERAIRHQETMNGKLETSLRVTTQATEQLTRGAKSTDEAAAQLERIVEELISVVGEQRNISDASSNPESEREVHYASNV